MRIFQHLMSHCEYLASKSPIQSLLKNKNLEKILNLVIEFFVVQWNSWYKWNCSKKFFPPEPYKETIFF